MEGFTFNYGAYECLHGHGINGCPLEAVLHEAMLPLTSKDIYTSRSDLFYYFGICARNNETPPWPILKFMGDIALDAANGHSIDRFLSKSEKLWKKDVAWRAGDSWEEAVLFTSMAHPDAPASDTNKNGDATVFEIAAEGLAAALPNRKPGDKHPYVTAGKVKEMAALSKKRRNRLNQAQVILNRFYASEQPSPTLQLEWQNELLALY